ncbi:hypothetical protein ScPMuIL_000775 [Solemya velum]
MGGLLSQHLEEESDESDNVSSSSSENKESNEIDEQVPLSANTREICEIPQNEKLNEKQFINNAGGFVWAVDDKVRLQRFLCLGSEGGSYYTGEAELTSQNAACIDRMIADNRGREVVETIRTFSIKGRCAKQNPTIFALAICARSNDEQTKKAAYGVLSDVCRIPTHLFQFIQICEAESVGTGWGRAHRRAVCKWYNSYEKEPMKLAMHVTKYKNRAGWSHLDLLRLCHIKPSTDTNGFIFRYIVKGLHEAKNMYMNPEASSELKEIDGYLQGVDDARVCTDEDKMAELIRTHRLVREHIPTNLLNSKKVWEMLVLDMPISAMIRNLGKMSAIGMLKNGSQQENIVETRLSNETIIHNSKLHPFSVLLALHQYKSGSGLRGSLAWPVNLVIVSALERAFYMAFKNVQPTGKRFCLAIDVSGSMGSQILGSQISCRGASAAMMMTVARTEKKVEVVAFQYKLTEVDIKSDDDLITVEKKISGMPFGPTDCAAPMVWASKTRKRFDVFIVYTDSETWFGRVHPSAALVQYRERMGIPDARLIVVAMASNEFSIADPDDRYMMDVVGFDSSAPEVMNQFITGEI